MGKRNATTAAQFTNMFAAFGCPDKAKALALLRDCPPEELSALLTALYEAGCEIPTKAAVAKSKERHSGTAER